LPQAKNFRVTFKLTYFEHAFANMGIIIAGDIDLAKTYIMPIRRVIDEGLKMLEARNFDLLFCNECTRL